MTDYTVQWQAYRKLRNLALVVLISFLLLLVVSAVIRPLLSPVRPVPILALSLVGAGVLSATIVTGLRIEAWRCPRCGRSFVSKWWIKLAVFFVPECAHCGLKKFGNG
jgi:hypothetical protein